MTLPSVPTRKAIDTLPCSSFINEAFGYSALQFLASKEAGTSPAKTVALTPDKRVAAIRVFENLFILFPTKKLKMVRRPRRGAAPWYIDESVNQSAELKLFPLVAGAGGGDFLRLGGGRRWRQLAGGRRARRQGADGGFRRGFRRGGQGGRRVIHDALLALDQLEDADHA